MKINENLYWYPLRKPFRALFLRGYSANLFAIVQERDETGKPTELWFIDIGTYAMFKLKLLKHYMKKDGLDFNSITKIFLTHAHPDHAAALYKLKKKREKTGFFPKVYIHPDDFFLLRGDLKAFWDQQYEAIGELWNEFFPFGRNFASKFTSYFMGHMPILEREEVSFIKDGDVIKGKSFSLKAIHTPGHTPGHTTYYCPELKALFCGDLIDPAMDHKPPINFPAATYADFVESVKKIRDIPVEIFCAAHAKEIHYGNETYREIIDGVLEKLEYARKRVIELLSQPKARKKGLRIKNFVRKFPTATWPVQEQSALAYSILRYLEAQGKVERRGRRFFLKEE